MFLPAQLQLLFTTVEILFAVGAGGIYLHSRRQEQHRRAAFWVKYISFFFIIHTIIFSILFYKLPFLILFLLLTLFAVIEVVYTPVVSGQFKKHTGMIVAFITLFCSILTGFTFFLLKTSPVRIITLFILVAILDAFSQLTGQLFGSRKLAPQVSPNKTVEGLVGGVLFCTLFSLVLRNNLSLTLFPALLFGLMTGFAGSAGDLTSSLYKRKNGIKDYNSLIPGQGGVMDRFVSFFFAANTASLYFYLNQVLS